MWSEGDTSLLRSVAFGHVRFAMPHTIVRDTTDEAVVWLPAGTRGKKFAGLPLSQVRDLRSNDWSMSDKTWSGGGVLKLYHVGEAHSIWLFWNEPATLFRGWYVNLEAPWRRTRLGWDTRDHALDIIVEPTGRWRWKDEDHLAAVVRFGHLTADEAVQVRAEGERVLEQWPFPTGWEEWRADRSWPLPQLPEGWDVV